jgi:hypothetical protein
MEAILAIRSSWWVACMGGLYGRGRPNAVGDARRSVSVRDYKVRSS